jgi:acyl carrier protein
MDKNTIIEMLAKKIVEDILKETGRIVSEKEALISSGLIDSFSLVDLALIVEDLFNVQIDDAELSADTFDTLDQLADLIQQRL